MDNFIFRPERVSGGKDINMEKRGVVVTVLPHDLFPCMADIPPVIRCIRRGVPIYVGCSSRVVGILSPGDVVRLLVHADSKVIGSEKHALGEVVDKGHDKEDGNDFLVYFNGGISPKLTRILNRK